MQGIEYTSLYWVRCCWGWYKRLDEIALTCLTVTPINGIEEGFHTVKIGLHKEKAQQDYQIPLRAIFLLIY